MSRGFESEFKSIDLLLFSDSESRGVDAFCLSWIKLEKQLRKISANLIYQASDIKAGDERRLRDALYGHGNLSHTTFIGAIRYLTGISVSDLIGARYDYLKKAADASYRNRQKIFHGQQTGQSLTRDALISRVGDIREWCELLSAGATARFGYDGFSGSTSLFKTGLAEIVVAVDKALKPKGWEAYARTFQR
ncbi:hypothetical protein CO659_22780 [Rhizobium sp. S9]|uniref:hypothetical protein n=1 Tax=Rhizobium sp. S9 TaxID=2035454 RepID=UPI000BE888CF|nr:hypothetical protein [Rhizobium sp. S9]PDS95470.1 hypothetical protein CO659_22780 [Rhizobium sp. S9]